MTIADKFLATVTLILVAWFFYAVPPLVWLIPISAAALLIVWIPPAL